MTYNVNFGSSVSDDGSMQRRYTHCTDGQTPRQIEAGNGQYARDCMHKHTSGQFHIYTWQWCNQDFFQDQDQDLNIKTKPSVQDQDFASQDQDLFVM